MMTDNHYDNEMDSSALWIKDTPSVSRPGLSFPGLSRFRSWLFPALTAVVLLIVIIALGTSNAKTSNRLWTVDQTVSNMSDIIQSLNASLQQAHETANEAKRLQFAVENNKVQLASVLDALKQLSALDSLSKAVASLKCSLEHIIKNSSVVDGCCPLGWEKFESDCFFFSKLSLSWNDSRDWCDKEDAHLLIVHTDKAWDFVIRETASQFFWVGLSDWRTGRWEWVNLTPYTMERRRWAPGQPDNWNGHGLGPGGEDCAHLHFNGRLNDQHCSIKMRFICQKHSLRV
ncbi:C-type lectin domain family 10 member A-like [Micropterus salmoides]|uniref:C-type lectin domain family 10 member A-like n=1 Tax=Micropterus salmoides TaxID=27706 RepID=UPI0018EB5B97|nr:C-type lectin domain family 10 member A-like [Micropterus salmoides]